MIATLRKHQRLLSRLEVVTGLIAVAVFALLPIIRYHSFNFVLLQVTKVTILAALVVKNYGKDTDTLRWIVFAMIISVVTDSAWSYR